MIDFLLTLIAFILISTVVGMLLFLVAVVVLAAIAGIMMLDQWVRDKWKGDRVEVIAVLAWILISCSIGGYITYSMPRHGAPVHPSTQPAER